MERYVRRALATTPTSWWRARPQTLERRADDIGTPAPYAVDDLVVAGRAAIRRRTARMWVSAALAVAVLVSAPSVVNAVRHEGHPAPAGSTSKSRALPARCTSERLPTLGLVSAMDPSGRFIVGLKGSPGTAGYDLVMRDHGAVTVTRVPGYDVRASAVNRNGAVVGTRLLDWTDDVFNGFDPDSNTESWLYQDGEITALRGNRPTSARAINGGGVAVGSESFPGLSKLQQYREGEHRPVVWRSANAEPTPLATPDGAPDGTASGIADDGTIVGWLHPKGTGSSRPYVWSPDGKPRELPLPAIDGTPASNGLATNIAGDWVGGYAGVDNSDVPVRWNLRTGEVRTFPEVGVDALVTGDGWMVGSGEDGRARLVSGPVMLTLLDQYEDADGRTTAVAISHDGSLIAGGGAAGSLLWHCG